MRKSTTFNLTEELEKALAFAWEWKLKQRAQMKPTDYRYAETFYLQAADLERRVRGAVAEVANGEAYGTYGMSYASYLSGGSIRGLGGVSLLSHCQTFLYRRSDLKSHNFGRGHISGARYRPHDWPLSPAEEKTLANQAKEKPVHFKREREWKPLCTANRKDRRSNYSRCFSRHRSNTHVTNEVGKVTCPSCLKALASIPKEARDEDTVASRHI